MVYLMMTLAALAAERLFQKKKQKKKHLLEKRSFKGKFENLRDNHSEKGFIFRHTSKPEEVYLYFNPSMNYYVSYESYEH